MAAKSKVTSTKSGGFGLKGGNGHMFSEREAGPQKPATSTSGGQDGPETQWAKGGSTKMFGQQNAGEQTPGQSAHQTKSSGKWAKGGSTKMFGYTGSQTAKPR